MDILGILVLELCIKLNVMISPNRRVKELKKKLEIQDFKVHILEKKNCREWMILRRKLNA